MKQTRVRPAKTLHRTHPICDRRMDHRVPIDVRLMYSAQDEENELIMGDGAVRDISNKGMRIRGNAGVKAGLDMTLFVYLPDGQDPLFVMSAQVAWTAGYEFGVTFLKVNVRERNRLRYFLRSNLPQ
jgi:c-di-GMP-binding flagellar brake protein YcgR